MEARVQLLEEQFAAVAYSTRRGSRTPDPRLGRPLVFGGDEKDQDDWNFKFKANMSQEHRAEPRNVGRYTAQDQTVALNLHYNLVMQTDKCSLVIWPGKGRIKTPSKLAVRLSSRYDPKTMGDLRNSHQCSRSSLVQMKKRTCGQDCGVGTIDRRLQHVGCRESDRRGEMCSCAVQIPASIGTHLLLIALAQTEWEAMRKSIQNYLIASTSTRRTHGHRCNRHSR